MIEIQRPVCPRCKKNKPQEFCWDGCALDCPLAMPPRYVTPGGGGSMATLELWRGQRWIAEHVGLVNPS